MASPPGGPRGAAGAVGPQPLVRAEGAARAQILIQDGELLEGTLCKKTLGASEGGLVHTIWMEEGPQAARAFLSQIQYTVNYWLLHHGFSIGIGDTVADGATMQIISRTIQQARPCWFSGRAWALVRRPRARQGLRRARLASWRSPLPSVGC